MTGTAVMGLRHNADGFVEEVTLTVEVAAQPTPRRLRQRQSNWLPATVLLTRIAPEYAAIRKAAADTLEAGNGQLSLWIDTLTAQGGCDLTDAMTIAAKTGLVQAGMLTQERADEVFSPA